MLNLLLLGIMTYQLDMAVTEGYLQDSFSCWQSGYLSVSEEGLLVNLRDKILIYDHHGQLMRTITPDLDVHAMALLRNRLVLTGHIKDTKEWVTQSVSLEGDDLSQRIQLPDTYRSLQVVDGQLYGTLYDYSVSKGRYPHLFHKIDPVNLEVSESMLKAPPVVVSNMSYKLFWVAASGDALVFVNQIENRAYFSTQLVRQKESRLSGTIKGITPFLELDVGKKVQFEPDFQLPGFDSVERNAVRWAQNRLRYSFNLFFSNLDDGYVICFEVPEKLDGLYVGNHLGIRFLDKHLRPRGALIERYGQIMGVHEGEVYIFYPSGEIEIPGDEASVRAHYGLTTLSVKTIFKVIENFNNFSTSPVQFKPVIEVISSP